MAQSHDEIPSDLRGVAKTLEASRPELTGGALDSIKRRAMLRGEPRGRSFMSSRIAILATLVTGVVFSGGGAALGISAITSTNDASIAQYGPPGQPPGQPPGPPPGPPGQQEAREVLGETTTGSPPAVVKGEKRDETTTPSPEDVVQPLRQAKTPGGSLPFTGYLAMPILLLGFGLLATGLVLRRGVAGPRRPS